MDNEGTHQELTFKNPIALRDPSHLNSVAEPHPVPILKAAPLPISYAMDHGSRTEFGSAINGPDVDPTVGKRVTYFGGKWTTGEGLSTTH